MFLVYSLLNNVMVHCYSCLLEHRLVVLFLLLLFPLSFMIDKQGEKDPIFFFGLLSINCKCPLKMWFMCLFMCTMSSLAGGRIETQLYVIESCFAWGIHILQRWFESSSFVHQNAKGGDCKFHF